MNKGLRFLALVLVVMTGSLLATRSAQAQQDVKLVGRAILPADSLAFGPQSGQAIAGKHNGVKLPFDTQPVGNFTAILPGDFASTWLLLTGSAYNSRANSGDFFLRMYTVDINMCETACLAGSDQGSVTVLDWWTFSDNSKHAINIKNANSPLRELTGTDFDPRGVREISDGSFWVAESFGPSLLHFKAKPSTVGQNKYLELMEAPIPLTGAGDLEGLGVMPDRTTLIVGQRSQIDNTLLLRVFDTNTRQFISQDIYRLTNPDDTISDITMINSTQGLLIEQDNQENKNAAFKQVILFDMGANPVKTSTLVDLLNIPDPGNISTAPIFGDTTGVYGLGNPFKFPYKDVTGVYPQDAQTLILVNDNHVPFGQGRLSNVADGSEFIAVQLSTPLKLDPAFKISH